MKTRRANERPPDPCVTGPHEVRHDEGDTVLVFRCESCGTESEDPALRRGCWVCDGRVGWR